MIIILLPGVEDTFSRETSVAQSDARPSGDQEVEGLNTAESATFCRGDLTMKYFLRSFFPIR